MKVVALHTDFRLYWPARLKALSEALSERDDTLEVIEIAGKGSPYAFAEKEESHDIKWHILFPKDGPETLDASEIKTLLFEMLSDIKPDVILSGAIAFPSGALAVQWGLKHGCRVVSFDNAKVEAVKRNPIVNFIKQAVYSNLDAMIYPAPQWDETGQYWGFDASRRFYGLNIVDNNFWSQPNQNSENPYGRYILGVGRQIPKKNFDDIIRAYSGYVQKVGKDGAYKLLLVGDGPQHSHLMQMAKADQLESHIIFLPFSDSDTLKGLYHNASAFCLASDNQETWGLVINEAMCGSCAIFASNACGATDVLVKHGENGYRFDCHDVEALKSHMIEYHNLSEQEKQAMAKASKRIVGEWGLPRFVDGCLSAIDFVFSRNKRKGAIYSRLIANKWNGRYRPV